MKKVVLTEFIAYMSLGDIIGAEVLQALAEKMVIASYALCGLRQLCVHWHSTAGIGGIAPKRMGDLASLGFRAMFAGVIAACMTGAIAGIML